jgi:hypothetical protein
VGADDDQIGVDVSGELHDLASHVALEEVREDARVVDARLCEMELGDPLKILLERRSAGHAIAPRRCWWHHVNEVSVGSRVLVGQPEACRYCALGRW